MELEEVYLLPDDDSRLYVLGGTNTYGSYDSLWARDLGQHEPYEYRCPPIYAAKRWKDFCGKPNWNS